MSPLLFDLAHGPIRGVEREWTAPIENSSYFSGVFALAVVLAASVLYRVPTSFTAWIVVLLAFFGIGALFAPSDGRRLHQTKVAISVRRTRPG